MVYVSFPTDVILIHTFGREDTSHSLQLLSTVKTPNFLRLG